MYKLHIYTHTDADMHIQCGILLSRNTATDKNLEIIMLSKSDQNFITSHISASAEKKESILPEGKRSSCIIISVVT